MRFRVLSALVTLVLTGLGIASCTQDFDQFTPTGEPVDKCPQGQKTCGDTCVPIDDTAFGCGSCNPCMLSNTATMVCANNECTVDTCATGFGNCDGISSNGCERPLDSDPTSCGDCDTVCSAINATALCTNGLCALGPCKAGWADCDGQAGNGCETTLEDDPSNCGQCGTQCSAFQTCANSKCVNNPCMPGTGDCNNDFSDGCETMLGSAENCSFCNHACNYPNGTGVCIANACMIESCAPGWENCDKQNGNGCEKDVSTITNCGACGNACTGGPNSTPVCVNGACGIECTAGFADCNNDSTDGCEVELASSAMHCGACGYACSNTNATSTACMNGVCVPTCSTGFSDCATPVAPMPDDGCEIATGIDVLNCGACGRACDGTNVASLGCTGGLCTSSCDFGYDNCNKPATGTDDGCEQLVQQSTANCGSCGNTCTGSLDCDRGALSQKYCGCSTNAECGAGASCMSASGQCVCGGTTCAPGENCANNGTCQCNGAAGCGAGQTCCQSPAGCFNLTTDANNCGACGRECPGGFVCNTVQSPIPSCRCDANADCNLGSPGTCNLDGTCMCGANQCAVGERCLANGMCG